LQTPNPIFSYLEMLQDEWIDTYEEVDNHFKNHNDYGSNEFADLIFRVAKEKMMQMALLLLNHHKFNMEKSCHFGNCKYEDWGRGLE